MDRWLNLVPWLYCSFWVGGGFAGDVACGLWLVTTVAS